MAVTATGLKVIERIPIERMLTESDGPFAKDQNGSALSPGAVEGAIDLIAQCKNLSNDAVRKQLMKNLIQVDQFVGYSGMYADG